MSEALKRPLPEGFPAPKQETERLLIERLQSSKTEEEYFRWLLFVVGFYRGIERGDSAKALLQFFLETSNDSEQKAYCHLALGQIVTDEQLFEAALNHFSAALRLNPSKKKVTYVLHNNTAYCLNRLGRHSDAESHCRIAIGIDSKRASAYRNLGLSLHGQADQTGAAWALVESIKADMKDDRARTILQVLIAEHPALIVQCPWIEDALSLTEGGSDVGFCV